MTTITLRSDLARKVQEIADQENRSVEEILENMIAHYQPTMIPDQSEDESQRLEAALHQLLEKMASGKSSDSFKLLTEILKKGVPPRQSTLVPDQPQDALLKVLEMIESDDTVVWSGPTDLSERAKEILETEYVDYLMKRTAGSANDTDLD